MTRVLCLAFLVLGNTACGDDDDDDDDVFDSPSTNDSSSQQDGAATADGTTTDDGGGGSDAADTDAPTSTADAAVGAVTCAGAPCDVTTSHCCVDPGAGTQECVELGAPCEVSTAGCDGPEDCMGETAICCAVGAGEAFVAACTAACMGGASTVVCHDTSECEMGEVCCPDERGFMGCIEGAACP